MAMKAPEEGYFEKVSKLNDLYRTDAIPPTMTDLRFKAAQKFGVPMAQLGGYDAKALETMANAPDMFSLAHDAPQTSGVLTANPWTFSAAKDNLPELSGIEQMAKKAYDLYHSGRLFALRAGAEFHQGILDAAGMVSSTLELPAIAERFVGQKLGFGSTLAFQPITGVGGPFGSLSTADLASAGSKAREALTGPGGAEQYLALSMPKIYGEHAQDYGAVGAAVLHGLRIAPSILPAVLAPEAATPLFVTEGLGQGIQQGDQANASPGQKLGASLLYATLYGAFGKFGAGKYATGLLRAAARESAVGELAAGAVSRTVGGAFAGAGFTVGSNAISKIYDPTTPLLQGVGLNALTGIAMAHGMHAAGVALSRSSAAYQQRLEGAANTQATVMDAVLKRLIGAKLNAVQQHVVDAVLRQQGSEDGEGLGDIYVSKSAFSQLDPETQIRLGDTAPVDVGDRLKFNTMAIRNVAQPSDVEFLSNNGSFHADEPTPEEKHAAAQSVHDRLGATVDEVNRKLSEREIADTIAKRVKERIEGNTPYNARQARALAEGLIVPFYERMAALTGKSVDEIHHAMPFRVLQTTEFDPMLTLPIGENRYGTNGEADPARVEAEGFDPSVQAKVVNVEGGIAHVVHDPSSPLGVAEAYVKAEKPLDVAQPAAHTKAGFVEAIRGALGDEAFAKLEGPLNRAKSLRDVLDVLQKKTGYDALYVKGTKEVYLPNKASQIYPTHEPSPSVAVNTEIRDPEALRGAYKDGAVLLTERADPSTFVHEIGHYFVDAMTKMAAAKDAPAELKDAVNAVLESAGGPSAGDFVKQTPDEQRAVHEKIVETFLKMVESDALRPENTTKAQRRVYDTLASLVGDFAQTPIAENPDISPETATMLAAIWNGRNRVANGEDKPVITPEVAQQAGIKDGVAGTVADASREAIDDAQSKAVGRVMKALRAIGVKLGKSEKAVEKAAKSVIQDYGAQVWSELRNDVVWVRAQEFSRSKLIDPEQRDQAIPKAVIEEAGAGHLYDALKKAGIAKATFSPKANDIELPSLKAMAAAAGEGPDGEPYTVPEFLVKMLEAKQKDENWVLQQATQRAIYMHTDLFDERANEDATLAALSNAHRSRMYRIEMNALNEAAGLDRIGRNELQSFAAKSFRGFNFKEAMKTGAFARAREQARANVRTALKHSDLQEAAREQRNVALLDQYETLSRELKSEHSKFRKRMQRLSTKKGLEGLSGNVAAALRDWARAYSGEMARSDAARNLILAETRSPADVQASLGDQAAALEHAVQEAWKDKKGGSYYDLSIPGMQAMFEIPSEHWTVKDFRALKEAVDFAHRQARIEDGVRVGGQAESLENAAEHSVDSMREANPNVDYTESVTIEEPKARLDLPRWFKGISAQERPVRDSIHRLFGKATDGVVRRLPSAFGDAWTRVENAQSNIDSIANHIYTEYMKPAMAAYFIRGKIVGPDWRKFKNDVHQINSTSPQLAAGLTREKAVVLTMHWGSAEGRDRIARWLHGDVAALDAHAAYREAAKTMQAVWDVMEGRDFDLAKAFWDANENVVKPVYAAMYRRVTGIPMTEVEAAPFTIKRPDGTTREMSGGYVHLSYDTQYAGKFPEIDLLQPRGPRRGMSLGAGQERQAVLEEGRPLRLDLMNAQRDMLNAVHVSQYNEPLRDWNRLLRHPKVRATIESILGKERYRQMAYRTDTIANPPIEMGQMNRWINNLQSRMSATILGWQPMTAALNMTALLPPFADPEIPKAAFIHAIQKAAQHPFDTDKYINSLSKMMATRTKTYALMMHGEPSFMKSTAESVGAYWLLTAVDKYTANTTWLAAYNSEYGRSIDNDKAVAFADDKVMKWHGSFREPDVGTANSRHNQVARLFKWMMPYFIRQRLTYIEQIHDAKKLWDAGYHHQAAALAIAHTFYGLVAPGLVSALAYSPCSMLNEPLKCGVENVGLYGSMFAVSSKLAFPVAVSLAEGRRILTRPLTPIGAAAEYGTQFVQGVRRESEGKDMSPAQVRALWYAIGATTHLPLGVVGRTYAQVKRFQQE